jgi:hypothetical protein
MLEVKRMQFAVSGVKGALVRLFRMGEARWCAYCGGFARHDPWEVHHMVVDQPRTYATTIGVTARNAVGVRQGAGKVPRRKPLGIRVSRAWWREHITAALGFVTEGRRDQRKEDRLLDHL